MTGHPVFKGTSVEELWLSWVFQRSWQLKKGCSLHSIATIRNATQASLFLFYLFLFLLCIVSVLHSTLVVVRDLLPISFSSLLFPLLLIYAVCVLQFWSHFSPSGCVCDLLRTTTPVREKSGCLAAGVLLYIASRSELIYRLIAGNTLAQWTEPLEKCLQTDFLNMVIFETIKPGKKKNVLGIH